MQKNYKVLGGWLLAYLVISILGMFRAIGDYVLMDTMLIGYQDYSVVAIQFLLYKVALGVIVIHTLVFIYGIATKNKICVYIHLGLRLVENGICMLAYIFLLQQTGGIYGPDNSTIQFSLVKGILGLLIGCIYFLRSERVKEYFVPNDK